MTKLSRWVGILEILSEWFEDDTPIFDEDDPFTIRFQVRPIVWLDKERAIPIREDEIWDRLTFTRGLDKSGSQWTGRLRSSLIQMDERDGQFLERTLRAQTGRNANMYPVDEERYEKLISSAWHPDQIGTASVTSDTDTDEQPSDPREVRESIKVQALLARIGTRMGMAIWIPKADKGRVIAEAGTQNVRLVDDLPLTYDKQTHNTIELIDVLWLEGRSIRRAFEVEHTTSINSGILRMADLLALQPNMEIKLHLVAPLARRGKVFHEMQRPVFEKGPLLKRCTYLSYDDIYKIARLEHLNRMSDEVLDDYAKFATKT